MAESIDIVVGIPSYNNANTIGNVVKAVDAGLTKYFPDKKAIIVNSDGGSKDGTPDVIRNTTIYHKAYLLSRRLSPVQRVTIPYHGTPGKGSAIRAIAFHKRKLSSQHLIKSLVPLYLGKTASFVMEMTEKRQEEAETEI